jgi:hypothetical protein
MAKDERDLLEVLKFELNFLEKGGYGRSPREPWRPRFIFEDSPTCMNYDCKENPAPCSDCVLMHWVPPESQEAKIPCRQIPLGPTGETLDSLYRYGDQQEIEEAVGNWLRTTIQRLEEERKTGGPGGGKTPSATGEGSKGTPLYQREHPKCANPGCATAFHWLQGGRFFRFRPERAGTVSAELATESPSDRHDVKHFWLCEHCSQIYTLVYTEENGVVLKLLRAEFPLAEGPKEVPVA